MATRAKIEGLDQCLAFLDEAPAKLLKMSKTATRKAAQATTKSIKARVPSRWKKLSNYKVKVRDGKVQASMGLFNKEGGRGDSIPDWFKAYWSNYGTLEGRDPSHRFKNAVKHRNTTAARNRKNKGGIKAQNFFEGAVKGWEDKFLEAFEKSLKEQENEYYK